MTINWFEGGRRIVSVLAGLIILGAAFFLFFGGRDNRVVVETSSPSERLHWTLKACTYPDMDKNWDGTVELRAGDPRPVTACFRAGTNGQIPYALGPKQTFLMKVAGKDFPISYSQMIYGEQFSDEVTGYITARMNAFKFTPEETHAIGAAQWKIGIVRLCERAEDAFPWVAGLIIGLWVFAAGIGWMIRGFASVPNGNDFKISENNQAARGNRASLDWMGAAIGGWAVVAGIAWLTLKGMMPAPATSIFGKYAGKVMSWVGGAILAVVGICIFFGAGIAFRALVYLALKRDQPKRDGADDKPALLWSFANAGIVLAGSWVLGNYTIAGSWSDAAYRWGFANGMQDSPQVAICALLLLWPIPPLFLLLRLRRGDTDAGLMSETRLP